MRALERDEFYQAEHPSNAELDAELDPEIDRRRCAVCGGLNPGDITHARC